MTTWADLFERGRESGSTTVERIRETLDGRRRERTDRGEDG